MHGKHFELKFWYLLVFRQYPRTTVRTIPALKCNCSWVKLCGFRCIEICSLVKRVLHLDSSIPWVVFSSEATPQGRNVEMKNSLHQTAFLNTPKFKQILPTTVENFSVHNPSELYFSSVESKLGGIFHVLITN